MGLSQQGVRVEVSARRPAVGADLVPVGAYPTGQPVLEGGQYPVRLAQPLRGPERVGVVGAEPDSPSRSGAGVEDCSGHGVPEVHPAVAGPEGAGDRFEARPPEQADVEPVKAAAERGLGGGAGCTGRLAGHAGVLGEAAQDGRGLLGVLADDLLDGEDVGVEAADHLHEQVVALPFLARGQLPQVEQVVGAESHELSLLDRPLGLISCGRTAGWMPCQAGSGAASATVLSRWPGTSAANWLA